MLQAPRDFRPQKKSEEKKNVQQKKNQEADPDGRTKEISPAPPT